MYFHLVSCEGFFLFLNFLSFSESPHPHTLYMCEYFALRCVCVPPVRSAQGGQKGPLGPLELELHTVVTLTCMCLGLHPDSLEEPLVL